MADNPLKKATAGMTPDRARQMATWARQDGKGELAAAWRHYAESLSIERGEPIPIDGKMRAAGE